MKKITFGASDSEADVHATIVNHFPKLSESGGYELMYCVANRRHLSKIDVKWDVFHLKSVIGGQSRIYVRPIQNSLSLNVDNNEDTAVNTVEYSCQICGKSFIVDELRVHNAECKTNNYINREESQEEQEKDVISSAESPPVPEKDVTFREEVHVVKESDVMNVDIVNHLYGNIDMPDFDSGGLYHLGPDLGTTDPGVAEVQATTESSQMSENEKDLTQTCIEDLSKFHINDPVHVLKYHQTKIVCGRKLDIDVDDLAVGLTGETNFIIVDRQNILLTGLEEISPLQNLRLTLEVQFYGEVNKRYSS